MAQLTVRTSEELVERLRAAARQSGRSMNEYVVTVLGAAVDPDLADEETERIRQRLARAGLLAEAGEGSPRPDAAAVAAARATAGRGTTLESIVSADRS